ncbi:MAG TPA: hypothetical protein VI893_00310 [Thermoplasmata archaeon]|nr:hypothetical protein [Thermoplasmata archaeon]
MGIDIGVSGRYGAKGLFARAAPPDQFLTQVADWFQQRHSSAICAMQSGPAPPGHALVVQLHPAGGEFEFHAPAPGTVKLNVRTSTVGPGYHQFACEAIRSLGQALQITWDQPSEQFHDETGYLYNGDRAQLEQHFLGWLQKTCGMVGEMERRGETPMALGMAFDHVFRVAPDVATCLGPRSVEWLHAVGWNPRVGIEYFPWWEPGTGPGYLAGRALALMWTEIRWRPPIDDGERRTVAEVLHLLGTAHRQDPARELPWREWLELHALAGARDPLPGDLKTKAASATDRPLIGYRRASVTVMTSGGWQVTLPGSMAEGKAEDGHLIAWEPGRRFEVSTITVETKDGSRPDGDQMLADMQDRTPSGAKRLAHRGEFGVGRAWFGPTSGEPGFHWRLQGLMAGTCTIAIATIDLQSADQEAWAVQIWKSLEHHGTIETVTR